MIGLPFKTGNESSISFALSSEKRAPTINTGLHYGALILAVLVPAVLILDLVPAMSEDAAWVYSLLFCTALLWHIGDLWDSSQRLRWARVRAFVMLGSVGANFFWLYMRAVSN